MMPSWDSSPGRGHRKHKGPEAGLCLAPGRNHEAGVERVKGRVDIGEHGGGAQVSKGLVGRSKERGRTTEGLEKRKQKEG